MKILITGANGEVGSDLVNFMVKKNHKIYAIYRSTKKKIFKKNKNLVWIKHDFYRKILKKPKVDIIINCIAAHSFSKKKNFNELVKSNIIALKNLIEYAKNNKIKFIFNLSTVSIYGKIENSNLTEEYVPNSQDDLGLTKYFGELLLFNASINYINIRLPGVLTLSQNFSRPWIKTIIKKIKNNQPLDLFNYKSKFNNLIDTHEIVNFIEFFLKKKLFKKKIKKTFNLAASKPITIEKIVKIIKKYYFSTSKEIIRKNLSTSYIIDVSKIYKNYGFYPSATKNILKRNLL
jgi:nucleoside-diphosphate-sugar epimerase